MKKLLLAVSFVLLSITLYGCNLESTDGPFTVTFDSMGGSNVTSLTVEANELFLPPQVPTKDGYLFAGWYLDSNYLYQVSFSSGTAGNITLYAKWVTASESLDEAAIRAIIEEVLSEGITEYLDSEQIENLINALLSSGELIDSETVVGLFESHVTEMIDRVRQSVVMIDTYDGNQIDGGGSGILYKKVGNTYYVLTNEHVVSGYLSSEFAITIFTSTGEIRIPKGSVTLRGKSLANDMAILIFTSTANLPLIEIGTRASMHVGAMVFAIGSPLDLPNTVTMGIISHLDREMSDDYGMDTLTVQHSAAINPGNSGGALVDIYGRLIGLNNMSYVDEYVGEGIEGLHFAIQIDRVMSIITSLE
jgi:uncharacterized repeat protein (TIGR02543 family)